MSEEAERAWTCLVCGYVHRGSAPPDSCPICGASSREFEASPETAPPPDAVTRTWRCLVCDYHHAGSQAPGECPVCGASQDAFEPQAESAGTKDAAHARRRIVILGAGIAGVSAAEAARNASSNAEIVLVSREQPLPYYRLNLTRYLAGEIDAQALPIHPEGWYAAHGIELRRGLEATHLAPDGHTVELSDGRHERYDALILACGAHPFVPPIPGTDLRGVITVRTVDDADALLEVAHPGMRCVCIGGGILGLETAGALARRGLRVTLLEAFDWLLPRQLNGDAAAVLARYVAERSIDVRYAAHTTRITGDTFATGVQLDTGETLEADLVVITVGIRPNTHLARSAGLEVNQGVVVSSRLAASHPGVYAAGDVAEHRGVAYGLWEPARYQGQIAGMNAAGLDAEFGGLPRANALKVLGVDLFSVGVIAPPDGSYTRVHSEKADAYCDLLFRDNVLVGAILIGDTRHAAGVMKAVKSRQQFSRELAARGTVEDVMAVLSA